MPSKPELPVFEPYAVDAFRAAIDTYRCPGAYRPGPWVASPLDRREEVLVGRHPERLGVAAHAPLAEPILARVKDRVREVRRVLTDDAVRAITMAVRAESAPAQ